MKMIWSPRSSSRRATFSVKNNNKKDSLLSSLVGVVPTIECPPLSLQPRKSKYEIAIVACGCFWNPQLRFQKMIGVKRVIVGYTGGNESYPTFTNLKDHTYAIFIEYNPKKVSYLEILKMWKDNDYPWEPEEMIANRSALFVLNDIQQKEAIQFVTELVQSRQQQQQQQQQGGEEPKYCSLYVDIEQAHQTIFYQAEESQQDYCTKLAKAAREQYILWANDAVPSGLYAIAE